MQSTTGGAHAYTQKFYHAHGLGQLELTLKDERIGRSRDRRWKFGEKKEAHGTLTVPIIELAEQGQRIVGVIEAREESIYERRGIRELDNPAWRPGDEDKRPLYVELTLDDAGERSAVARDAWEWLIGKMAAATGETTEETQKGETGSAPKEAALGGNIIREQILSWPQVFRCNLDTDSEVFDRAFYLDAQTMANRNLFVERLGIVEYGLTYSFVTEKSKKSVKDDDTISISSGDEVCRVSTGHYRTGLLEVKIERYVPMSKQDEWPPKVILRGENITLWSPTDYRREAIFIGGMLSTLKVLDWIKEHYGIEATPEIPLAESARFEQSIMGHNWLDIYNHLLLRHVGKWGVEGILKRYALTANNDTASNDQVTAAPASSAAGDDQVMTLRGIVVAAIEQHPSAKRGDISQHAWNEIFTWCDRHEGTKRDYAAIAKATVKTEGAVRAAAARYDQETKGTL